MANERSRPGVSGVRKSAFVGPEYAEPNFVNPWNVGIDRPYGSEDGKTLLSPSSTIEAMGAVELNGMSDYDSNWEHGVRGGIEKKPKGPRTGSRWTPRGAGEKD